MRRISQILSLLLAVLMTIGLFTGCKKEVTTEEIMKKYSDQPYKYVDPDTLPIAWSYGKIDDDLNNIVFSYSLHIKDKYPEKAVRDQLCYTLPLDQFGLKLQTQLMSGEGPDMIITAQTEMFSDIVKVINSGVFTDWDKWIADWDTSKYMEKAIDGVYSRDGKHYLMPISFQPKLLITTKSSLEKYGLTEDDFSDMLKTTETLYRLWQTVEEEVYPTRSRPDFTQALNGILDYDTAKTTLQDADTRIILDQWQEMFSMVQQRHKEHPLELRNTNFEYILNGEVLVEFTDLDSLSYSIYEYKDNYLKTEVGKIIKEYDTSSFSIEELNQLQEQLKSDTEDEVEVILQQKLSDLVILPLYDSNHRVMGDIKSYALLSSKSQKQESIAECMQWIVEGGYLERTFLNVEGLCITEETSLQAFYGKYNQGYTKGVFTETIIIDMLKDADWNLRVPNATLTEYHDTITNYLYYPETADWEELERSINIYLSE